MERWLVFFVLRQNHLYPLILIRQRTQQSLTVFQQSLWATQSKVLAWYDNEWGYSARVVDLTKKVASAEKH